MRRWLLPEYIEDILPAQAERIERLRARMLELCRVHGYQLVIPPLLEFVESLLTGTGRELDLVTFKLVDQLSGRHMGVRADITPQVTRIDAHLLNRQGVVRLCYAGSALHTLPGGPGRSREPLQLGAELYGHAGLESDIEVQRLMIACLDAAGRAIARAAGLGNEREREIFQALQGKDRPALATLSAPLAAPWREALLQLPELYGDGDVLDRAAQKLPAVPEITTALADLRRMAGVLCGEVESVSFDLAELRGYHYHTGMVFAAYAAGSADAVARGGRYDEIGRAFGRARPATGFSIVDLRQLVELTPAAAGRAAILAPPLADAGLAAKIGELRAAGEIVVIELPGSEAHRAELQCTRRLMARNGRWELVSID